MLAGPGFGNDSGFTHPPGEQDLAERIINLVRPCVIKFIPFEIDFCAPKRLRKAASKIERTGAADVVFGVVVEFILKLARTACIGVGCLQFKYQWH